MVAAFVACDVVVVVSVVVDAVGGDVGGVAVVCCFSFCRCCR